MNAKKLLGIAALALGLAACGGGGDYDHRVISVFDINNADQAGFTGTTSPPADDAQESVANQLKGRGEIILQIPAVWDGNFAKYLPHLLEADKHHDRITTIYVKDEMFHTPRGGVQIGLYEQETTEAALAVQAHGFKSAVSILPQVILAPNFKLANMKAFDVIGVDVYPSQLAGDGNLNCAPVTDNPVSNLLYCSVEKLRTMGYTGEIWFLYQAFGDPRDPMLKQHLQQQRETILQAPTIGVNGLVSFGYDMYSTYEAPLFGLKGTSMDPLVSCAEWCTQSAQIATK